MQDGKTASRQTSLFAFMTQSGGRPMTHSRNASDRSIVVDPSYQFASADRRRLLKAGAGAAALALAGPRRWIYPAAAQDAATALPQDVCILTPEMTEGPYYVADPLLRRDVTE